MKKYRFFYHYFKARGKMSVHFKGKCTVVDDIICLVPCGTKWRNTQPKIVMQGFAENVIINNNKAVIL